MITVLTLESLRSKVSFVMEVDGYHHHPSLGKQMGFIHCTRDKNDRGASRRHLLHMSHSEHSLMPDMEASRSDTVFSLEIPRR